MLGDEEYKYEKFTVSYSVEMDNGQVSFTVDFLKKIIIIDAASKITKEHNTFRGAFRITIYLKDNDDIIKKAKAFAIAVGNYVFNFLKSVYDQLVGELDSLQKLPQISSKMPVPYQPVFSASLGFKLIVI